MGATGAQGATGPGVATGGTTGQILVKNSATNFDTAWVAQNNPYFPPQAPPATGFNSFTDTSFMVWSSYNGSAWRRAFQVMHARVYRTAALTTPTSFAKLAFDTVDEDVYGMFSMANNQFVAPLIGWYALRGTYQATGSNMMITIAAYKNGVLHSFGNSALTSGSQTSGASSVAATIHCSTVGDTISVWIDNSIGAPVTVGRGTCYATLDYMGSGG